MLCLHNESYVRNVNHVRINFLQTMEMFIWEFCVWYTKLHHTIVGYVSTVTMDMYLAELTTQKTWKITFIRDNGNCFVNKYKNY